MIFSLYVTIHFQVKYEKYISTQVKEYNILEGRKRISYKPAVIYYMQSVLLNNHDLNKKSLRLLRQGSETYKSNYLKDEYILECFYSKKEKTEFINSFSD